MASVRGTRGKRSIGFFAALNNISVAEGILRVFLKLPSDITHCFDYHQVHNLIASYCLLSNIGKIDR